MNIVRTDDASARLIAPRMEMIARMVSTQNVTVASTDMQNATASRVGKKNACTRATTPTHRQHVYTNGTEGAQTAQEEHRQHLHIWSHWECKVKGGGEEEEGDGGGRRWTGTKPSSHSPIVSCTSGLVPATSESFNAPRPTDRSHNIQKARMLW